MEVVEYACGLPQLLKGEFSDQVSTDIDAYSFRQPLGVCAGITPFNFPIMVPMWMHPMAIAMREHVRAQAVRARPVGEQLRRRALPRGRPARRRVQRRARRQGGRRRAAGASRRRRRLVRRLHPDRALRVRHGQRARQARAGAGRREEPRRGDARRRPRLRRQPPHRGRLRLRGAALHGHLRRRRRRRRRRAADGAAEGEGARGQGRPGPRARRRTWARSNTGAARDRITGYIDQGVEGRRDAGRRRPRRSRWRATASSSARRCSTTSRPTCRSTRTRSSGPCWPSCACPRSRTPSTLINSNYWANGTAIFTLERAGRAHLPAQGAGRHDRHQRADPGADGLLLLRGLEGLPVRRPPHPRPGGHPLLHARQGGDQPLARGGARRRRTTPATCTSRPRSEAAWPGIARIGVIGAGLMGTIHVRLLERPGPRRRGGRGGRRRRGARRGRRRAHGGRRRACTGTRWSVVRDPDVDAVVVASSDAVARGARARLPRGGQAGAVREAAGGHRRGGAARGRRRRRRSGAGSCRSGYMRRFDRGLRGAQGRRWTAARSARRCSCTASTATRACRRTTRPTCS